MSKGKSTYLQHLEEQRIKGEQEPNVCLLPPTDKKRQKNKTHHACVTNTTQPSESSKKNKK